MKLSSIVSVGLVAASVACVPPGVLPGTSGKPDVKVSVAAVTLEQRPGAGQLAALYCAENAGALAFGCRVFGDVPVRSSLRFTFKVELEATNPSPIAIPVVAALVGFQAYPEAQGAQNLGSVCVSMCEDPNQCPQVAEACESNEPDIRSTGDFANAAAGFLVNAALTDGASLEALRLPMVPPGGNVRFFAALSLDVNQMLNLIAQLGGDVIGDVKAGRQPDFTIPWAVEGSVFVKVESFGKFGVNFPLQTGTWKL